MERALLPYFDGLIDAWTTGRAGRHAHLGFWDYPPALSAALAEGEFIAAQARLAERVLQLATLSDGLQVLDVGCGLGGTLASIDSWHDGVSLTGVNIDARQLAVCSGIRPRPGNSITLVQADAVALPFPAACFDRVFCIEAAFHFGSRGGFLAEAARVLRPGGRLLLTDILLEMPTDGAPWNAGRVCATLQRDYGNWPEPWTGIAGLQRLAADAGLQPELHEDWSAATLPSWRAIAPDATPDHDGARAGTVLRWMHAQALLHYPMLVFRRPWPRPGGENTQK